MDPARYLKVMELFVEAVRWPPDRRGAALAELAADDPAVRDEVLSLLEHHHEEPSADQAALGAIIDGRYRIATLVDADRRGSVYRAERLSDQHPVTIELYPIDPLDDRAVPATLVTELAGQSPALAALVELGVWESPAGPRRYVVLESLEALIVADHRRTDPDAWSLSRVVQTLDPIAQALMLIADRGVVHGAVDARHIVAAAPAAMLLGLGGAQLAGGVSDPAEAVGGAPEQQSPALGPIGPWTDVYGLARVCVELMRGRSSPDDATGARACARDDVAPPTPRMLGLEVSAAVEAVMSRALATRPIERYQDVRRFWTALRHSLVTRPTSRLLATAGPQPRPRRRRWWAAALATAVAAAVGAVGVQQCG